MIGRERLTITVCEGCGEPVGIIGHVGQHPGSAEERDVEYVRADLHRGAVSGTPEQRIAAVLHDIGFGAERHALARDMLKLAQGAQLAGGVSILREIVEAADHPSPTINSTAYLRKLAADAIAVYGGR